MTRTPIGCYGHMETKLPSIGYGACGARLQKRMTPLQSICNLIAQATIDAPDIPDIPGHLPSNAREYQEYLAHQY